MRSILVLDDQLAYIRALERSLRRFAELTMTATVEVAKTALRRDIEVALVDICLSQEDGHNREGLDFISWLRSQRSDIVIIAMSALDDPEIPVRASEAGADRFLSKPLRISELMQILSELQEDNT